MSTVSIAGTLLQQKYREWQDIEFLPVKSYNVLVRYSLSVISRRIHAEVAHVRPTGFDHVNEWSNRVYTYRKTLVELADYSVRVVENYSYGALQIARFYSAQMPWLVRQCVEDNDGAALVIYCCIGLNIKMGRSEIWVENGFGNEEYGTHPLLFSLNYFLGELLTSACQH